MPYSVHGAANRFPASGFRHYGTVVYGVGCDGRYWSATPLDESIAWLLSFISDVARMGNYSRGGGRAVRLVRDVK